MTSARQIDANRENSLRSTGPRTPRGKAVASRNKSRHGLYASTPVIPRIESPAAWSQHRCDTLASLSPVGHVETALAERVALILWRLGRVARYEQDVSSSGRHRVHEEVTDRQVGPLSLVENQEKLRIHLTLVRATLSALTRFTNATPETPLAGRHADLILGIIAHQIKGFDLTAFRAPNVLPDDAAWHNVPEWTVGLLHRFIAAIATSVGREPGDLITAAMATARDFINKDRALLRPFDRQLRDLRRERILPQFVKLELVMQYEKHLTRQLAQTLAELRLLQRARVTAGETSSETASSPSLDVPRTQQVALHPVSGDSKPIADSPPPSQPPLRRAR
jgi:hypothetical protein